MIALGPASAVDPDPRKIGDEPALLAKALPAVPIVVCADRYRGGGAAEERFDVGVHVLDDGFQHWALARDVDIVALDVTQNFSDRALLPAGRQREPCAALARAHLVVITRTELSERATVDELERQVRRINPRVDVFRAVTRLHSLRDVSTGRTEPAETLAGGKGKPVAAFCGLGNPRAFFRDLRYWGFQVAGERAYRDHHVYSGHDLAFLQQLAARSGAEALVTTEKDSINLSPSPTLGGVPIFACVVRIDLEEGSKFQEILLERLERSRAGW
jgi:tetraacyldisaccharide 4'-kinase